MVARRRMTQDECPTARALDVVGDWWSLLIVRDAFDGATRFSEFQKRLGIARNILTQRLRALVDAGILELVRADAGSGWQDYRLTEKGRGLFPVIVALRQWGESHLFAPGEWHSRMVSRETGEPVGVRVQTATGTTVAPEQAAVLKLS